MASPPGRAIISFRSVLLLWRESLAASLAAHVLKVHAHLFIWREAGIAVWAGDVQRGAYLLYVGFAAGRHGEQLGPREIVSNLPSIDEDAYSIRSTSGKRDRGRPSHRAKDRPDVHKTLRP